MENTVTPEQLHILLRYDRETGRLFWRERSPDIFQTKGSALRACKIWNTRYSGQLALDKFNDAGYRCGRIFGRIYRAHRVIWAMQFGEWPDEIDHINHDRADNRLINLRNVSRKQNMKNVSLAVNNTSGVIGVSKRGDCFGWRARIKLNGVERHLGSFATIEEAKAARVLAQKELGFHENHGASS